MLIVAFACSFGASAVDQHLQVRRAVLGRQLQGVSHLLARFIQYLVSLLFPPARYLFGNSITP